MPNDQQHPPGHPGIPPRWTSSAKSGVGTALSAFSSVWFTVSHGILNEVYYPFIDLAATRDLGLLVTGQDGFFSEEKRDTAHAIEPLERGVPAYRVINTCDRYRITKRIVADPQRSTVLQEVVFEARRGTLVDYTVYALLAPHLGNRGQGNTGWTGDYKGVPMLFAQRQDITLALAASVDFQARSCGYVGVSDGWTDLRQHGRMTWHYARAEDGNIALTGALSPAAADGRFVLALGFGRDASQAGHSARASLLAPFEDRCRRYLQGWRQAQQCCRDLTSPDRDAFDLYRTSTAVLKTHESKRFPGAMIASLSTPWGDARGDDDGGYHLVWPRDLVESAGGLLAAGDAESARQTLFYLMTTQEADGHWPQNMWLGGDAYWKGIQEDETAFFILLADALRRRRALAEHDPWPTIRKAVGFLVRSGPETEQDRWEENAGYSVFTLTVEVAALLAAADFAAAAGEKALARYLRETADAWNDQIERWTYARDTALAHAVGVDGYYVRFAPPDFMEGQSLEESTVQLKNRPAGQDRYPAADVVSVDALALVRFGLRAPDDPRIRNTVRVIDAVLRTETATGPGWHRYTHDGYGEHEDGSPFDGTGVGRLWPLLAGERAHYELAAGNRAEAERLLHVMVRQTSPGGLLPEQVWDGADLPEKELRNGHPSGSGMPLVWAHAEVVKLLRSLQDGAVFDQPPQPVKRYQRQKKTAAFAFWRFDYQRSALPEGKQLRLEVLAPATVRWSADDWATATDLAMQDTGVGVYVADLPVDQLREGQTVRFTFRWEEPARWEGRNFDVTVRGATS